MSTVGQLTSLYSFCSLLNCEDGVAPFAGVIQATNGSLYGTTNEGGADYRGTVFRFAENALTTLHSFDGPDGSSPYAGVIQATDGKFYGTSYSGGVNGNGAVFSLYAGLGPFVETNPTAGRSGTHVKILGGGLTDATSVTFNGTAATFTVVSDTEITTTVPTGATTGKVQVTTPSGTLTSNVVFRVKP
jgi:uncharacterized repeat protein (TIGR03803 family)